MRSTNSMTYISPNLGARVGESRYRVAKTHRIPYLYIFRKSDLYLVALLWKTVCNLEDPMSLRHPVIF